MRWQSPEMRLKYIAMTRVYELKSSLVNIFMGCRGLTYPEPDGALHAYIEKSVKEGQ